MEWYAFVVSFHLSLFSQLTENVQFFDVSNLLVLMFFFRVSVGFISLCSEIEPSWMWFPARSYYLDCFISPNHLFKDRLKTVKGLLGIFHLKSIIFICIEILLQFFENY